MSSSVFNLSLSDKDKIVTINGWVEKIRDHGGVIFIDLRKDLEIVQVVIEPDEKEIFNIAEQLGMNLSSKLLGRLKQGLMELRIKKWQQVKLRFMQIN